MAMGPCHALLLRLSRVFPPFCPRRDTTSRFSRHDQQAIVGSFVQFENGEDFEGMLLAVIII